MDLGNQRVDIDKSTDGVWVDVDATTKIKIARFLNSKHKAFVDRAMKPHKRASRVGQVDDEITDKIEIEALANCVLLGWEGLTVKGKEVKYSVKQAIEFLSDPALPQFITMVRELSTDMTIFHEIEMEDAVENIKKSSRG
jgi:hypothetical protein